MQPEIAAGSSCLYTPAGLGEEDESGWVCAGEYGGCVGAHVEYSSMIESFLLDTLYGKQFRKIKHKQP